MSERELDPGKPEDQEEVGFVSVLLADPADVTTRLAYSDWLQEHDRNKQARYLREIRKSKFVKAVLQRGWFALIGPHEGKPLIPAVIDRFAKYREVHPAWGGLHIVLEDHNCGDDSVAFCIQYAIESGDVVGERLGRILLEMSGAQRGRIAWLCERILCRGLPGRPDWNVWVGDIEYRWRIEHYSEWVSALRRGMRAK